MNSLDVYGESEKILEKYRNWINVAVFQKTDDELDYVMIFQNPGKNVERKPKEAEYKNEELKNWFLGKKRESDKENFKKIFDKIEEAGLINCGEYSSYIKEESVFDDFYITDFVKISGIKGADYLPGDLRDRFQDLLKKEIEEVDPRLILVFGGDAWEGVKEMYDISVEDSLKEINDSSILNKITEVHGVVFNQESRKIVPLIFPVGQGKRYYDELKYKKIRECLDKVA